jgi:hypothetical protein
MRLVFGRNMWVDGNSLDVQGYNGLYAGRGHYFEKDVEAALVSVSMFRAGRAVLNAIGRCGQRSLSILPYVDQQFNARAHAIQLHDSVATGQVVHGAQSQPQFGLGTGRGSSVQVLYTPWITTYDPRLYFLERRHRVWNQIHGFDPQAPGNDQGELLVHELVHAVTMMAGCMTGGRPMPGGWDDEDEFRAIIVADIYSSERGRPLRQTHRFGIALENPQPWRTDPHFKRLLGRFITALPDLAGELGRIDTPFNPLRGNFDLPDSMRRWT